MGSILEWFLVQVGNNQELGHIWQTQFYLEDHNH